MRPEFGRQNQPWENSSAQSSYTPVHQLEKCLVTTQRIISRGRSIGQTLLTLGDDRKKVENRCSKWNLSCRVTPQFATNGMKRCHRQTPRSVTLGVAVILSIGFISACTRLNRPTMRTSRRPLYVARSFLKFHNCRVPSTDVHLGGRPSDVRYTASSRPSDVRNTAPRGPRRPQYSAG